MKISKIVQLPYYRVRKFIKYIFETKENCKSKRNTFLSKWKDIHSDQMFHEFFENLPNKQITVQEIYHNFCANKLNPDHMSKSTFYNQFIKLNQIKYKKIKFISNNSFTLKHIWSRMIFLYVLNKISILNENLWYFDESSFEILNNNSYAWQYKNEKAFHSTKLYPIKLKLLLLVNSTKIISYYITVGKTTGEIVTQFLEKSLNNQRKIDPKNGKQVFIVMDNATKNKVKILKNLALNNQFIILYTCPHSPFSNFVENIFNMLKKKMTRVNINSKYVN